MILCSIILLSACITSALADNQLVGYEGCNPDQTNKIKEAFTHAKKIMDVVRTANIDWNSAPAVELLGPPGFNQNMQGVIQGEQAVIQGIIHDVAKVNGGSIHTDLSINVRCDDWDKGCRTNTEAYTTQLGPSGSSYQSGVINFCPRYFDASSRSLDQAVEAGRNEYDWQRKYDLGFYVNNRALTLIHELLHIDWVASADRYGPNLHVKDFLIEFHDPDDGNRKKVKTVYGARNAKILARWNDHSTTPLPGRVIARSAENLAVYTLAVYMIQQLGAYPHLPIVNTKPDKEPNFRDGNPFEIDSNGKLRPNMSSPDDDISIFGNNGVETVVVDQFLDDSLYPKSYLDDWHHWANPLTQQSNFHNQLHDGSLNVATMVQSTWSNHTVSTTAGSGYTGVFDGWAKYWSPACPNAEATFMWPASYGDVYLKSDGYLHDGGNNRIGTIKINCAGSGQAPDQSNGT